jgi:hypothetical protein
MLRLDNAAEAEPSCDKAAICDDKFVCVTPDVPVPKLRSIICASAPLDGVNVI